MSDEDLERYEATIELQLVQEYKAVIGLFSHIVETERRFYLANEVEVDASTPRRTPPLHRAAADTTPGSGTCTARPASCPRCGS